MPMHDWTRVDAGVFHDFHLAWAVDLRNTLNEGVLPPDFYALVEQHTGRRMPDLIALHYAPPGAELPVVPPPSGGLALAEAPPQVAHTGELPPSPRSRRRTVAIRHVSGHRLVAALEIVSPANKDRLKHIEELAGKIDGFLGAGVHVMLIDVFPPGSHDPQGIDAVVREFYGVADHVYESCPYPPPCVVSYCAGQTISVYFQPLAVGRELPDMPLFIHEERYVNLPLEASYLAAFRGAPNYLKTTLDYSG